MRDDKNDWFYGIRILWGLLTLMLAVGVIGGIAYGGGLKNVYVTYASREGYALTALLILSLVGLWITRHR